MREARATSAESRIPTFGVGLATVVGSIVFVATPRGSLAQAITFEAIAVGAAVAITLGFARNGSISVRMRALVALGVACNALATHLWYVRPVSSGIPLSFPSAADGLYFTYYAVIAIVLFGLVRIRDRAADRSASLDAAIIALGAATVSWAFVIGPYLSTPGVTITGRLVSVGYPLFDLLMLAALTTLLAKSVRRPATTWWLTVGVVAQLVADAWYALTVLDGTFTYGHPMFVSWIVSYGVLAVVALHPSSRQLTTDDAPSGRPVPARLVVAGAAALLGPAMILVQIGRGSGSPLSIGVLSVMSAASFVLVLLRMHALTTSMSALREAQHALAESETRFRTTVEATREWIWQTGADGVLGYSNPAVRTLLGHDVDDLVGLSVLELMHEDDRDRLVSELPYLVAQGIGWSARRIRWRHADGTFRSFESNATPIVDMAGTTIGFRGVDRDISDRLRLEEELTFRAFHDSLTGLANRALFVNRLEQAVTRRTGASSAFSVLMIDVDEFKAVNDTLGHEAGDIVLRQVAHRIRTAVRPSDTVARIGGDEFGVVMERDSADVTDAVAARIVSSVKAPFTVHGRAIYLGVTVGVARWDGEATPEDLLRNADAAMYLAKLEGKGGARVFESGDRDRAFERLGLAPEIRAALDRDELMLRYQPIVELDSGKIRGVEALVRWNHPERGELSPAAFLPAAEAAGLISAIDTWVLWRACRTIRRLQETFPGAGSLRLSVNLSPSELRRGDMAASVAKALRLSGLSAESLVLEITEEGLVDENVVTLERLEELRALGVRLAIDDFGVGYSSLGYLRRLPVHEVKIDRSFVADIASVSSEWVLARTIVRMLRDLEFETVAEGIEDAAQLAHLRALGCELGQGYFFARPLTEADLEDLLARRSPVLRDAMAGAVETLGVEEPTPDTPPG